MQTMNYANSVSQTVTALLQLFVPDVSNALRSTPFNCRVSRLWRGGTAPLGRGQSRGHRRGCPIESIFQAGSAPGKASDSSGNHEPDTRIKQHYDKLQIVRKQDILGHGFGCAGGRPLGGEGAGGRDLGRGHNIHVFPLIVRFSVVRCHI